MYVPVCVAQISANKEICCKQLQPEKNVIDLATSTQQRRIAFLLLFLLIHAFTSWHLTFYPGLFCPLSRSLLPLFHCSLDLSFDLSVIDLAISTQQRRIAFLLLFIPSETCLHFLTLDLLSRSLLPSIQVSFALFHCSLDLSFDLSIILVP